MVRVAFYIDSHGFGHATRSMALIEALPESWHVLIRSNVPAWLFQKDLKRTFELFPSPLDIHPRHVTSYRVDIQKTLMAAERKLSCANDILAREADWLRDNRVDLVLSDIAPLAVQAASNAGIPSSGISNFTWDWIFEPLFNGHPSGFSVVHKLREMTAQTTLNFRLPFSDPGTFPQGSIEAPLLVRPVSMNRQEARQHFGFDERSTYFLLTFGGIDGPVEKLDRLREFSPVQFIQVSRDAEQIPTHERILRRHPEIENFWILTCSDLYHPDLVLAVDGVLTKPGYGILSECMATATPLILDSRDDFREFTVVRETVSLFPQCAIISNSEMEYLEIGTALEKVLAQPPLPWQGETRGDKWIAARLVGLLQEK